MVIAVISTQWYHYGLLAKERSENNNSRRTFRDLGKFLSRPAQKTKTQNSVKLANCALACVRAHVWGIHMRAGKSAREK